MPKERSPNRDKAFEIYKKYNGNIKNREIAKELNISEKTISSWKYNDKWKDKLNKVLFKNNQSTLIKHRKKGGQPKNQNAVKHGLFAKYLPEETKEIIDCTTPEDYLNLLWDNIKIQYAAILRSQKIMYVNINDDDADERQTNFLNAQSRAMTAFYNMIKNYDEMLLKNSELATEEQRARIELLKAKISEAEPKENDTCININICPAVDNDG